MLNKDGIHKSSFGPRDQILANVSLQSSVGCVLDVASVPQSLRISEGGRVLAKAGTPLVVTLVGGNQKAIAVRESEEVNALLLHDVVLSGHAAEIGRVNGTALLFGFVNYNRVHEDVRHILVDVTENMPLITLVEQ